MGDVPFGVSYYSADVWADRESFVLDWSGGAPPEKVFKSDPFTEKWGQNWGIPLYNWDVMRGNNFRWWRQRVRMVRELLDLFRIDHVLGCYRIYAFPWRPVNNPDFLPLNEEEAAGRTGGRLPGFKPRNDDSHEDKEANRVEGEALLRVLLEETGEFRLIGEDLGTVPDYVRPNMQHLGIAGFKVPQWEREWHGEFIRGEHYERLSVTTYATHDHDPIRSMWDAWSKNIAENNAESDASRMEMHRMMRFCGLHTEQDCPEFNPRDASRDVAGAFPIQLLAGTLHGDRSVWPDHPVQRPRRDLQFQLEQPDRDPRGKMVHGMVIANRRHQRSPARN